MKIEAKLVQQLRQKTGAGMMDCKKALLESNGSLEDATVHLRKAGITKALCVDNNVKIEKVIDSLTARPRKIMGFNGDLFSLDGEAEITVLDDKQE